MLDDKQWVLVSIDPERDTPEMIDNYAKGFDADFIGLSASRPMLLNLSTQLAVNNKMPPMLDRRSSSQKQVPMNVRDRSMRGGGNDMEYEDIDSRGSGGGRSGGRMDTIDRTGGTYGDPR